MNSVNPTLHLVRLCSSPAMGQVWLFDMGGRKRSQHSMYGKDLSGVGTHNKVPQLSGHLSHPVPVYGRRCELHTGMTGHGRCGVSMRGKIHGASAQIHVGTSVWPGIPFRLGGA